MIQFGMFNEMQIKDFYTYRTATAFGGVKITDQTNKNMLRENVKNYLEEQGYRMDNHICWTNIEGINFMWSDNALYIGGKLTIKNW